MRTSIDPLTLRPAPRRSAPTELLISSLFLLPTVFEAQPKQNEW